MVGEARGVSWMEKSCASGLCRSLVTMAPAVAPIDRDSFISSPAWFRRPLSRASLTFGGKKSSSQPWIEGINPDQKIDRPPKVSCGFSPMKFCESEVPPCQKVSHPKCFAKLAFEKRQRL
jgi:hypothetical protein